MARLTAKDVTVSNDSPVDGYWIDLPFGWVMPDGEHGIVEESEREALAALAKARLCECDWLHGEARGR